MYYFTPVPVSRRPVEPGPSSSRDSSPKPSPYRGAIIPYPIPIVIGVLVVTQILILLGIISYLIVRRPMNSGEKNPAADNEITSTGARLWRRFKGRLLRYGHAQEFDDYKASDFWKQDADYLNKWRQNKRDMFVPTPISFTVPTKPEVLARHDTGGNLRAFPLPLRNKPNAEPWTLPGRPSVAPALSSGSRTKSFQEPTTKKVHFGGKVSRSQSVPANLGQISATQIDGQIPKNTLIGQIEPTLYCIDERNKYTPSKFGIGKLSFSLFYDAREGLLTIYLIQAVQLPATTERATADTFVKVSLIPEEEKRSATSKVQRHTLNPIYRQNFIFRLAESDVADTAIRFTIVSLDRYSHPVHVGQVVYQLCAHEFTASNSDVSEPIWRNIEKSDSPEEPQQGDLLFSLTYLPNAERVTVIILKARNLHLPESEDLDPKKLDTFVKITVVKGDKVIKNKQTSVARRSANPVYNEAFTLDLCEKEQICIVFAVCLRVNPFAGHKTLGRCLVGSDKKVMGDGAAHWRDMMSSPRSTVTQWHPLR